MGHDQPHHERDPPSPFVVAALDRLDQPRDGAAPHALDVACGRGRHAVLLGRRGFRVHALDRALPALETLAHAARRGGIPVACVAADVTTWPFPEAYYALVVVTRFLPRGQFDVLRRAVAPGGALLIETFLDGQQRYGHPRNPDYLLRPGELVRACDGWSVLDAHEGRTTRDGRPAMLAGILARRPRGAEV